MCLTISQHHYHVWKICSPMQRYYMKNISKSPCRTVYNPIEDGWVGNYLQEVFSAIVAASELFHSSNSTGSLCRLYQVKLHSASSYA